MHGDIWLNAKVDTANRKWDEHDDLTKIQICGQVGMCFCISTHCPKDNSSNHDQEVHRCQNHAQCGDGSEPWAKHTRIGAISTCCKGAKQTKKLTDKAIQSRKAHGSKDKEHHEAGPHWHLLGQAPEFAPVSGVISLVHHPNEEEERAGGEPMVDHVEH